ncbi:MAG: hypothetical protein IT462_17390 [Planctomycetes bacterium]|nr:hypothetical protein [Planctomycetota bacterium]
MRFVLAMLLVLSAASLAAETINDSRYQFTAEVPPGFQRWPAGRPLPSNVSLHCFYQGILDGEEPVLMINFERLGGVIGRETLQGKTLPGLPPGAAVTTERWKWKEFEIDVLLTRMTVNGVELFMCTAQVPLKPEAIQVIVGGVNSREAEARSHLQFIVARLDGKSNWLSDGERIEKLAQGAGSFLFLVLIVLAVVYFVRKGRKRPIPAGYYAPGQPVYGQGFAPMQAPYPPQGVPPQWGQPTGPQMVAPAEDVAAREQFAARNAALQADAQRRQVEAKARRDAEMAKIAGGGLQKPRTTIVQKPPVPAAIPQQPSVLSPKPKLPDGRIICPACGGQTRAGISTCMNCGAALGGR